MRSGLFGGTFDPIHNGHLLMAENVCKNFPLDRIVFIPAARPPHKLTDYLTPANHRMTMIQLAIDRKKQLKLSDYEIQKGGICYTIDTVRWFQNSSEYGSDELYLLMGADSLLELDTWKNPGELLNIIQVLVFGRPDYSLNDIQSPWMNRYQFVRTPLCGISATQIRKRVRDGLPINDWVPDRVLSYIKKEGLYRGS